MFLPNVGCNWQRAAYGVVVGNLEPGHEQIGFNITEVAYLLIFAI